MELPDADLKIGAQGKGKHFQKDFFYRLVMPYRKSMNCNNLAEEIKKENVIDIAVTFTAMIRVFEKNSKKTIVEFLAGVFTKLSDVESQEDYNRIHADFCSKFSQNIKTTEKKLKNGSIKRSKPASFGHAAKVLDIAIKVYVHYSSLPDATTSKKIKPLLKGAIDTPILNYLTDKFDCKTVSAKNIQSIDKIQYETLQGLVAKDIKERFNDSILPVQYDDILWNELNR